VFLSEMPEPDPGLIDEELGRKWDQIFRERDEVLKALEEARNGTIIGHSLDAKVVFYPQNGSSGSSLSELFTKDQKNAEDVLIVSQGMFVDGRAPDYVDQLKVAIKAGQRGKHIFVDLPDGSKLCVYDSALLNRYIEVARAKGSKCERCWKYSEDVGKDSRHPTVCARCSDVLRSGVSS
ncbi:MAG: zinc finger domain-containing protein, partial [Candidatus Binatia bacterium]